ncbi:MAG: tripartite tricarboxylate transporter TctB family protein [Cytophagales bacterium]|nr:tripartite tricarboxylate transporter TctB family protein [Cytophagales bacterium]
MRQAEKTVQMRWMELVVASFFIVIGGIVIFDSFRTGFRWGSDGPQPGYFPFYIGLILVLGALWIAAQTLWAWRKEGGAASFANYEEISLVLKMLLPTIAYVLILTFAGLYVASSLFIMGFMIWQGKYTLVKSVLVAVIVSLIIMIFFEIIFQVPLPKNSFDEGLVARLSPFYASIKVAIGAWF